MSQFSIERYVGSDDPRFPTGGVDNNGFVVGGTIGPDGSIEGCLVLLGNTAPPINPTADVFTFTLMANIVGSPTTEYVHWEYDSRDFPDQTSSIQALVDWFFARSDFTNQTIEARWRGWPGSTVGDISAAGDGSSACPPTTPFVRSYVITDKDAFYANLGITSS